MELNGDAPVPPSKPAIKTTSAFALVTPAAMVPTPALLTNFTLIRAARFAFFKSKSIAINLQSNIYHGGVVVKLNLHPELHI